MIYPLWRRDYYSLPVPSLDQKTRCLTIMLSRDLPLFAFAVATVSTSRMQVLVGEHRETPCIPVSTTISL